MDITGYALVVGGASGIGKACAVLFAKEGASGVMVADLNGEAASTIAAECRAAATNPNFRVADLVIDVTREDSVQNATHQMLQTFGRMDYCVNSAGIGVQQGTDIADLSLDEFRRFLDVNATGMFLVTRQVTIAMRAQELLPVSLSSAKRGATRGVIVNVGSASSLVASPGVLPYTASKHAALGLTKNAALDNASHGIRVNCVCPSWVDTPMVQTAVKEVQGLAEFIRGAVPIGRMAEPDEIADAIMFLCSPRSSYANTPGFASDLPDCEV